MLTILLQVMNRNIIYILLLTIVSCGRVTSDDIHEEHNPFADKLKNYVFHDDVYHGMDVHKVEDSYFLVVNDEYKSAVIEYLTQSGFTIFEGPDRYEFGLSTNFKLPEDLQNCYSLCFSGAADVLDIHNVVYCGSLYYIEHPTLVLCDTTTLFIDVDYDEVDMLKSLASVLNLVLLGPWIHEDNPWLQSPPLTYAAVCTTQSPGNCLEIYNCICDFAGLADVSIYQLDNPIPGI